MCLRLSVAAMLEKVLEDPLIPLAIHQIKLH